MEFRCCVPCLLGLEGPIAEELRRLDLAGVRAENGRVWFTGGPEAVARANIGLRCGERVLLELGHFPARSFEELFQGARALPWEELIPANGAFPVTGYSLNSQLHSVPDCQRILKKALAERLGRAYGLSWLPEDGAAYPVRFSIMKDQVSLCLDTSGTALHKRGYRPAHNAAPLRETLAAALVTLSRYRGKGDFADPFCGSGTIPIEAALIAKNRAPGLNRSFAAMAWDAIPEAVWEREREAARAREFSGEYRIFASDLDPKAVAMARENARRAGVEELICFDVADAAAFSRQTDRGVIVTNPPYGERILEKQQAEELYRSFGQALRQCPGWSVYLLSSHTELERCFGAQADKKRKLYNGMIPCNLFMFYGGK